jgi:inhibitor of KinA sporulation pathway (predicted exonuclease)
VIAYEVTVEVDDGLIERYTEFMQSRHIPQVLATGCFTLAEFDRASETRFRARYLADSLADLERYLERHAPRLRAEYATHFPEGTKLTREIWEELHRWKAE